MRPYLAALLLTSCAMLVPVQHDEPPPVQPSPVETEHEGKKEPRKPKAKPAAPVPAPVPAPVVVQAPMPTVAHCAALDAGNLKDTIRAKLDCIKESVDNK